MRALSRIVQGRRIIATELLSWLPCGLAKAIIPLQIDKCVGFWSGGDPAGLGDRLSETRQCIQLNFVSKLRNNTISGE
jgi:hypothetical protein